jgi:hypothetical protein
MRSTYHLRSRDIPPRLTRFNPLISTHTYIIPPVLNPSAVHRLDYSRLIAIQKRKDHEYLVICKNQIKLGSLKTSLFPESKFAVTWDPRSGDIDQAYAVKIPYKPTIIQTRLLQKFHPELSIVSVPRHSLPPTIEIK